MGKKKPSFYRSTISIPADLKRRMDKAAEEVNWSAVAAAAFEAKLAEIASRKVVQTMDDVVTRLRASKQKAEGELFQQGFKIGQQWARTVAEAPELERLERLYSDSRDWLMMFDDNDSAAYGHCEWLVFQINPKVDGDRDTAREFWLHHKLGLEDGDDRIWKGEFVRGFAEGALEVWDDVKSQL